MDALHRLTAFGDPPSAVVPHIVVLLAATVVAVMLGNRLFRYD